MGRKARLKKFKKALRAKLESMGLKDESVMVLSKSFLMPELVLDDKGQPILNEKGAPQLRGKKVERFTAKNPLRNIEKKILREIPSVIEEFIGTSEEQRGGAAK